jgi:hypothetical protein
MKIAIVNKATRSRAFINAGICAALFLTRAPSGWGQTPQPADPLVGQYFGLFGKTGVHTPLVEQAEQLPQLFRRNPYLKGLTVRTTWKELEPEEGRFNWDGMDRQVKWTQKDQFWPGKALLAVGAGAASLPVLWRPSLAGMRSVAGRKWGVWQRRCC